MGDGAKFIYLVHNLADPAVSKRVGMFLEGGAQVSLAGFARHGQPAAAHAPWPVTPLGETHDARLLHRAISVCLGLFRVFRLRVPLAKADAIIARNLEMLILGWWSRFLFNHRARLVYECLDVHRSMLVQSTGSRLLRWIEGSLLRRCDLLVVSSPAFIEGYFLPVQQAEISTLLVENKPHGLRPIRSKAPSEGKDRGRPWRIGWFGIIRCRRSLDFLIQLAEENPGLIEVVIRGRPFRPAFADFDGQIARSRSVSFGGSYSPAELPDLYAGVDFTWAIDFYEEGQNSSWLLPNRLYEGSAFGSVPIALAEVETGRWLQRRNAGIVLNDLADLKAVLLGMNGSRLSLLRESVSEIPEEDLFANKNDSVRLVQAVAGNRAHATDVN